MFFIIPNWNSLALLNTNSLFPLTTILHPWQQPPFSFQPLWMHLSKRLHINGTMYLPFDVLAYRPQGSSMLCGHRTLLFKGWTVFTIFFFTCSFIHQWILGLLPYFDSCEYCCESGQIFVQVPHLFCFVFTFKGQTGINPIRCPRACP